MKGQLSISDWLASMAAVQEEKEPAEQQEKEPDRPSEVRIRQGSSQGSWKTVTYEEARKWARGKWEALKGVQEAYRAQYINMYLVEGVEFRDEELKGKGA